MEVESPHGVKRHDDHKVLRFEVPVDDQWHVVRCSAGELLWVASRHTDTVEFWQECWTSDDEPCTERTFIVIGTGHPIPVGARWRGTTLAALGLVWHLYEQER